MPCFNLNKSNFNKDNINQYNVVADVLRQMSHLMEITWCTAGISVYVLNWIMTVVVSSPGKKHISSFMHIQLILIAW